MAEEAQTIEETPPTETAPSEVPPSDPASSSPNGSDGTLGDGGGGDDSLQVVPATWPADWREQAAKENTENLRYLKRYKSPESALAGLFNLRSRMDGGEFKRTMPSIDGLSEEKAAEAMTAWRTEAGIPETAEAYYEGLPEGMEVRDEDKPYLDNYFSRMQARGISAADAHEGLQAYYEGLAATQEAQHERDTENRQQSEDALRAEWGPEYRGNLNGMHALFDAYAPEGLRESLFSARMADGTPLGDSPGFLGFMVGLAREMNPGGTVTPIQGQTQMQSLQEEIASLEKQSADTKGKESDYWANPGKQARLRELYGIDEKMKARAG